MNKLKKISALFLALSVAVSAMPVPAFADEGSDAGAHHFVKFEDDEIYIDKDSTKKPYQLKMTYFADDVSNGKFIYESKTKDIGTIYQGKVTPKSKLGVAEVVVNYSGTHLGEDFKVTDTKTVNIIDLGLETPSGYTNLLPGEKVTLGVSYTDDKTNINLFDYENVLKDFTWSSSKPAVATVFEGTVTAKSAGTTTITASTKADFKGVGSCQISLTVEKAPEIKYEISSDNSSYTIKADKSLQLQLNADNVPVVPLGDVTWKSSDPEIANIYQGKITAKDKSGKTTISAMYKGATVATREITIEKPNVSIAQNNVEISKNQTIEITANKDVTLPTEWSSNNTSIATVNQSGIVTGNSAGDAIVTAKVLDASATVNVSVASPAETISFQYSSMKIELYQVAAMINQVSVSPAGTSVAFTSSNTSVASFKDSNGTLRGDATGTTIITARTPGGATDTCTVQIIPPVTGQYVRLSQNTASMKKEASLKLSASVNYSTGLKWESSNTKVATVDNTGLVKAVGDGNTTIKVSTTDGTNKFDTCTVTVTTINQSVSISPSSTTISTGNYAYLYAFTNVSTPIRWSSSNTRVATVDSNGRVYGISNGVAYIEARTTDGTNKYATATVYVNARVTNIPVQSVAMSQTSLNLEAGNLRQVFASVYPTNATNKSVAWSSSNTRVAVVTESGYVSAIGEGYATIYARAVDGSGKQASMNVTVQGSGGIIEEDDDDDYTQTLGGVTVILDRVTKANIDGRSYDVTLRNADNKLYGFEQSLSYNSKGDLRYSVQPLTTSTSIYARFSADSLRALSSKGVEEIEIINGKGNAKIIHNIDAIYSTMTSTAKSKGYSFTGTNAVQFEAYGVTTSSLSSTQKRDYDRNIKPKINSSMFRVKTYLVAKKSPSSSTLIKSDISSKLGRFELVLKCNKNYSASRMYELRSGAKAFARVSSSLIKADGGYWIRGLVYPTSLINLTTK